MIKKMEKNKMHGAHLQHIIVQSSCKFGWKVLSRLGELQSG